MKYKPKVLAFDVFGTVVDWRSSLIAELTRYGKRRGIDADWTSFVDDWRGAYHPAMDGVRTGRRTWCPLDELHRESLVELVGRYGLERQVPAEDLPWLTTAWHRLLPWSDSVPGLLRLRTRYTLVTMSNGNVALMTNLAKYAGLPWDCILSAELSRAYKPAPQTYALAWTYLNVEPSDVMMVAAHNRDLKAAAGLGMMTAYVNRPTEYGPRQKEDFQAVDQYDFTAASLVELAELLES